MSSLLLLLFIFGVMVWFVAYHTLALPLTGFVAYVLLSLCSFLFYITARLEGEIPTSIILRSFKTHKRQNYRELCTLFTRRGLIDKRIGDLLHAGLIRYRRGRYVVTARGHLVAKLLFWYQWVFHRPSVG